MSDGGTVQVGGVFLGTEELLRSVLEAAPAFIGSVTPEGRILFINRLAPGFTQEDIANATVFDFTDPAYHDTVRGCMERVMATGEPQGFESVAMGANRALTHYETRVAPILRDGKVIALTFMATDTTVRKLTELALRESEERLRMTVASAGMGLFSWDALRDETTWDNRMCEIAGLTREQAPRTFADYVAIVHPEDRHTVRDRVERRVAGSQTAELNELRIVRPDGEVRWVHIRSQPIRDETGKVLKISGGALDVTERRAVEERLRQSQKMEAVGQLTAGIAHNFNNLLMAILPNLELATRLPAGDAAQLIGDARHAAERAADLVRKLLLFAGRRSPSEHTVEHLGPIVERTLSICRSTFDPRIAIEVVHGDDVPPVEIDAGQIEQALLNVCLNARDALAGRPAPLLHVSIDTLTAAQLVTHPGAARRTHARIRLRDSGHGMDDATRRRIFEPFFTTKPVGKGTGLGLATAYGIVESHRGWMTVESAPGEGTTFSIVLPGADGPVTTPRSVAHAPVRGGTERILVVDDELLVRQVVARLLAEGGYDVVIAGGAREALELFDADDRGFALVLLDLSMPDASGRDVCKALRERRADQRVVYFSGDTVDSAPEADGVVLKPVGADALLLEVRRVLDRP